MSRRRPPGEGTVAQGLDTLFAPDGPLSKRKALYSRRPEQVDLARAVEEAFASKGLLLADAPTGTGKSLGYLAPAILRAAHRGEKFVISTATLALQAQLLTEDLPPAKAAVADLLGYPEEEGVSYAVMKGRRNFLCTKRHLEALMGGTVFDAELVANLDRWAAETQTGDREDPPFAMPISAWAEVASDGDDCSPRTCTYREGCHYYAHRDTASEAEVLVVNHALLLANAASYGAILETEGRHLIIDEAHRLEEIMAEAFGARVSYARVLYVLRQARKRCEEAHEATNTAEMAAELFFEDLRGGSTRLHESPPRAYGKLVDALRELRAVLASAPSEEVRLLTGMVGRLRRDIECFYSAPDDDYAYAVISGRAGRKGQGWSASQKVYPELKSWLVEASAAFRDGVLPFFNSGGVILTSATLASGKSSTGAGRSFSYVRRRLGLEGGEAVVGEAGRPEAAEEGSVRNICEYSGPEVFDYASRVLIYHEDGKEGGIPAPTLTNADAFARRCARRAGELVRLSGGRALVVLSTKRAVSMDLELELPR